MPYSYAIASGSLFYQFILFFTDNLHYPSNKKLYSLYYGSTPTEILTPLNNKYTEKNVSAPYIYLMVGGGV